MGRLLFGTCAKHIIFALRSIPSVFSSSGKIIKSENNNRYETQCHIGW